MSTYRIGTNVYAIQFFNYGSTGDLTNIADHISPGQLGAWGDAGVVPLLSPTEYETSEQIFIPEIAAGGPQYIDILPAVELDYALRSDVFVQSLETDSALALTYSKPIVKGLTGIATEVGAARILLPFVATSESDSAQALSYAIVSSGENLVFASETDAALALSISKAISLIQPSEADSARALTFYETLSVTLTSEADAALALAYSKPIVKGLTGIASEVNASLSLGVSTSLSVGTATETELARILLPFMYAPEADTALAVTFEVVAPAVPGYTIYRFAVYLDSARVPTLLETPKVLVADLDTAKLGVPFDKALSKQNIDSVKIRMDLN